MLPLLLVGGALWAAGVFHPHTQGWVSISGYGIGGMGLPGGSPPYIPRR